MTEKKENTNVTEKVDTSPARVEDVELSASEMEGVVGGRSRGEDNVRTNHQPGDSYGDDDRDR